MGKMNILTLPIKESTELNRLGYKKDTSYGSKYFDMGLYPDYYLDINTGKTHSTNVDWDEPKNSLVLPSYQQAFDWFLIKHGLHGYVKHEEQNWWGWYIQEFYKDDMGSRHFEKEHVCETRSSAPNISKLDCIREMIELVKLQY